MRIFRHHTELPTDARGAAVAIGNFDGVHRGHQAVIGEAGRIAQSGDMPWAVLTFEPHPRQLFRPGDPPFRLTPFRIKARSVEAMGADEMIVLHFDRALASLSADDFISEILVKGLGVRHVVAGYDFVFGQDRKGDCDLLLHRGRDGGFDFTAVGAVKDKSGEVYSSTRVRDCLVGADPVGAAAVLGRPFEIEGRIAEGDKRGRSIGFPTANVPLEGEYLCPAMGVYAVRAGIDKGTGTVWHNGVANLGVRPTFGQKDTENEIVLETHFLDGFDQDIYGQHLRVALVSYIREEQKFDGVDALKEQIGKDCIRASETLQAAGYSK